MRQLLSIALLLTCAAGSSAASDDDPYLWLEEVENEKALAWAKEKSTADTAVIEAVPEYAAIHEKLIEIVDSRDRIPTPEIRGPWIYNFWQDAEHVRGIWRRATPAEFATEAPAWRTVLDLDALAEAEQENWVWKGATCLLPEERHCLVSLSRGGADAAVVREFDTVTRTFVEGGFVVAEAKSQVSWKDADTLWLGTDFGEGSLTASGYPRTAREWTRGTALDQATVVFEGSVEDVAVAAYSDHTPEGRYDLVKRVPEFYRDIDYLRLGERLVKLDLPQGAQLKGFFKDHLLVTLRSDWSVGDATYPGGALLAIDLDAFLEGGRDFEVLFEPGERVVPGRRSPRPATTSSTPPSTTCAAASTALLPARTAGPRRRSSFPGSARSAWTAPATTTTASSSPTRTSRLRRRSTWWPAARPRRRSRRPRPGSTPPA